MQGYLQAQVYLEMPLKEAEKLLVTEKHLVEEHQSSAKDYIYRALLYGYIYWRCSEHKHSISYGSLSSPDR